LGAKENPAKFVLLGLQGVVESEGVRLSCLAAAKPCSLLTSFARSKARLNKARFFVRLRLFTQA
jgi:hypothetical protein